VRSCLDKTFPKVKLLSAWDVIPFCGSVEAAESIACLEGVKHALVSGDACLLVESYCAFLQEAFKQRKG
jgi:hypothetical protein